MSGKKDNKKKPKKAGKKPAKLVYSSQVGDPREADSTKVDTTMNLLGTNPKARIDLFSKIGDAKVGIKDYTSKYFDNVAFKLYKDWRTIGYSIKGAVMAVALSAVETGWGGDKNAMDRNNFFNIRKDKKHFKKYSTSEEGIEAAVNFFDDNTYYVDLRKLVREDDPYVSELGWAMKSFNPKSDGGYGTLYASYMNQGIIPTLLNRMLRTISGDLLDLQNKIDAYQQYTPKDLAYLSQAAPFLLSNTSKLGLQAINELKGNMLDLQNMEQELKTGIPVKGAWPNKGLYQFGKYGKNNTGLSSTPIDDDDIPTLSDLMRQPVKPPFVTAAQANGLSGMSKAAKPKTGDTSGGTEKHPPQASSHKSNIPTTDEVARYFKLEHSGSNAKNGSKDAAFNINMNTNDKYHNHYNVSEADIYNMVVKILTDAAADHKIGRDIH